MTRLGLAGGVTQPRPAEGWCLPRPCHRDLGVTHAGSLRPGRHSRTVLWASTSPAVPAGWHLDLTCGPRGAPGMRSRGPEADRAIPQPQASLVPRRPIKVPPLFILPLLHQCPQGCGDHAHTAVRTQMFKTLFLCLPPHRRLPVSEVGHASVRHSTFPTRAHMYTRARTRTYIRAHAYIRAHTHTYIRAHTCFHRQIRQLVGSYTNGIKNEFLFSSPNYTGASSS